MVTIEDPTELKQIARDKYDSCFKRTLEPITVVRVYIEDGIKHWVETRLDGTPIRIKSKRIKQI